MAYRPFTFEGSFFLLDFGFIEKIFHLKAPEKNQNQRNKPRQLIENQVKNTPLVPAQIRSKTQSKPNGGDDFSCDPSQNQPNPAHWVKSRNKNHQTNGNPESTKIGGWKSSKISCSHRQPLKQLGTKPLIKCRPGNRVHPCQK